MRLVRCCAVVIWWLVAWSRPVLADAAPPADVPRGQLTFRVFGGADGLRNLVIGGMIEDRNGFLWIGTDDGVYRFDGARFTHFGVGDGLLSGIVTAVGLTPDGSVCVGSSLGLVCWDGARFSRAKTAGLPELPIAAMVSFAGKLWVGTTGAGLYVQDGTGVFMPAPGWPGARAATIQALWADEAGLVVGNGASVELTAGDGAWRAIGDVGLGAERVVAVLRDGRGALWIRTPTRMSVLPQGAAHVVDSSDGLPSSYEASNTPNGMALGPRGEVLVATDAGIASREHDRWHVLDRAAGMPVSAARTVFVDHERTMWVGSIGLFQLRGRNVVEHHDVASGFVGDVAWGFQRDRHGTLWAATTHCLARAIAGRWECLPGTVGRVVRGFAFPPQGGVFLGGVPADLLYVDDAGHTTSLGQISPDHGVLALSMGPEGDLWIATRAGLYRLAGAVAGPLVRVVIPGTRPDARFASLTWVNGQLWTATVDGVLVLDRGTWRRFDQAAGFRSSSMRFVIARADGRLCAAYVEVPGVVCFRYDGRTVASLEHIGPAEGLASDKIYFLGEDRQQRLWVGTGNGIDVVTPDGVDHFDERDGLAGDDSASTAFLLDSDGSLWLGSTGGATHLRAQDYAGPLPAPRTALVGGRLGDQPIRGGDAQAALDVPHDRNALTLAFAAGSLLEATRIEYEVRLSPLESAWSATRQREARYPALLPGGYGFAVRARIGAGRWGPATELRFTVRPAWWQTRWFLAGVAVAGALAIGAAVRWWLRLRTRQLHAQTDTSFRAVIDLMPDLISVHRDGALIYLNLANRRFLGLDHPGDRWDHVELIDRIHADDRAQVTALLRKVRGSHAELVSELVETRMRGADGSWRSCELSAVLVEIGGAPTLVISGRDVTERNRMRAKLLVADRMASLGTLAAGIAHEINNPLAYVAGNLEGMAETLEAAASAPTAAACAELSAAIAGAQHGAERVRKIVRGLRSLARAEVERRVPLALPEVLEAAIQLTSNELRHRAQLVRELGPVPPVLADDGRLTQVFINLLVNAAHAIPEGHSDDHHVTVRTRTDDQGRAVIEVEDTGKGIALEVQARVFDPFFTTKSVGEGTGLGLSICHGIIAGLDGQISIESAPGRGTLVRIVLPASSSLPAVKAAPASAPVRAKVATRRHRVMLVDDEPQVAHTMERLLRRDYDVTVALCGQDALDHITGGAEFDAIVSDVMMPNMTGIQLIEELQRVAPEQAARLIFLSGGAFTAQARERLEQLGVQQLEKPITAKELRACVMRVAEHAPPRS